MRHDREEVIERVKREFEALDRLVAALSEKDWGRHVPRPEVKEPWTVKDALAHITYWKANTARAIRNQHRPPEERGLQVNDLNHLVWERWRERPAPDILAWHRQVQEDVLAALCEAPDEWFGGKERSPQWPFDIDGHSAHHRARDLEAAVKTSGGRD